MTQESSELTQQHLILQLRLKIKAYTTVLSKSAYICDYSRKIRMYMRLWKQNPRTGRKRHKNRANRQAKTKFTSSRPYWENMPPDPTQKQRNQEKFKYIEYQKPPKEKQLGTSPVWSPILLQRETSYGLGCTIIDSFETRNQYFPI